MLNIYTKQIRKNWFFWSLPSLIGVLLAFLMVAIWPSFEPFVAQMEELLANPIYQAFLGEGAVLTTFEGFLGMELFIISDLFFMALIILFGVQIVTREVESGTLDFMLSYPVPRWRFFLEKLFAFITVTFSYPLLIWAAAVIGAEVVPGVDFRPFGREGFFLGLFARWVLYMTLTSIVILFSIIFMDTGKTLAAGGLLLGGSFILDTLGGLVMSADKTIANYLQSISLYYYLDGQVIMNKIIEKELAGFPLLEFGIIGALGIVAIILSIVIFDNPFMQKREFK